MSLQIPMATPRTPIELLAPMGPCPIQATRPKFLWRTLGTAMAPRPLAAPSRAPAPGDRIAAGQWRLRLWEMPAGASVSVVMRTAPLLQEQVDSVRTGLPYPSRARALQPNTAYLWLVERLDARRRPLSRSAPGLFFVEDPSLPFPRAQWLCCEAERLLAGDVAAWQPAYGEPVIDAKGKGCRDSHGVISLRGTVLEGDAVSQQLEPGRCIEAGRHYLVSFCARVGGPHPNVRFRVIAHNGPLPSSGRHPTTSGHCVPIGETGRIGADDWTWVVLPPWRAPRSFTRIAIAAIGDSGATGADKPDQGGGDLSAICVRQIEGCDVGVASGGMGPEVRFGEGVRVDPSSPPLAQMVSTQLGPMEALFGPPFDSDGHSNWYQAGDRCASIGGWVPPHVEDKVPWHQSESPWPPREVIDKALEQVLLELKDPGVVDELDPIPFQPEPCEGFDPAPFPRDLRDPKVWADPPPPFAGRDIAFVHGFVPSQVIARIVAEDPLIHAVHHNLTADDPLGIEAVLPHVRDEWPNAAEAFTVDVVDGEESRGYFREFAEDTYWRNHIREYLTAPGHPNRYVVLAYNCSQRLVYGVHAVLYQLAAAMTSGAGVRVPEAARRGSECFGRELVIISHSTGALVTNVAMAVAARTADDETLRAIYGDISGIAERAVVHLSMHGALAGSEAAQLAVAGAGLWGGMVLAGDIDTDLRLTAMRMIAAALFTDPGQQGGVEAFFSAVQSVDDAIVAAGLTIPRVVFNSVLVDLSPVVTRTFWRPYVGGSPVPTLTLSGGHPSFGGAGPYVLKPVLPGLDDGVVSTNSQAGSDNLIAPDLYASIPPRARLFDMGLPLIRSAAFFLEQDRGVMAAYGASPFLSPSGMVQPVAAVAGRSLWNNVHPFLQATSEHSYTTNPNDAGQGTGSLLEEYLPSFGARNYEESLVVETPEPFTSGLVDPALAGLVFRYERRLDLTVTLTFQVPRITLFPPAFSWQSVSQPLTVTLWRRFYDLLGDPGVPVSATMTLPVELSPDGSVILAGEPPAPDAVEAALVGEGALGEMTYAYRYVVPV